LIPPKKERKEKHCKRRQWHWRSIE